MRRRSRQASNTLSATSTPITTSNHGEIDRKSSKLTDSEGQAQRRGQAKYQILIQFIAFAIVRTISALTSPIADCDETFNYWEPMHYLIFGYGFQTWEYSPEFALRSYAYLFPYALTAKAGLFVHGLLSNALPIVQSIPSKIFAFYFVRVANGIITAFAETYLCSSISFGFGSSVNRLLFVFLLASPGMFRSSVEFLPSSFAMICLMLAFAAWIQNKEFLSVFMVALGSLLGWIFAAVLAIPMALQMLFKRNGLVTFIRNAVISGVVIGTVMVAIDSYYFGKIVFAPLNHVLYNVFPEEGAGSHIFGVDSWKFYVFNLLLNTNITILLCLSYALSLPIKLFSSWKDPEKMQGLLRELSITSSLYLALFIFFTQPHKEERFLAPCYPFIAMIAAIEANAWMTMIRNFFMSPNSVLSERTSARKSFVRYNSYPVILILYGCLFLASTTFGVSRIIMQIHSYRAPLKVYHRLSKLETDRQNNLSHSSRNTISQTENVNVCVGKEWYRFPSNFFTPHLRTRLRFVRDGFTGLLPKPFSDSKMGTRVIPEGMNAFNREDPKQFFDWSNDGGCHYIIDLDLHNDKEYMKYILTATNEKEQPDAIIESKHKFLDSERSPKGYRAFFIPFLETKLVHADYLLIQNANILSRGT